MRYVARLAGDDFDLALGELSGYVEARGSPSRIIDKSSKAVVFEANEGIDFTEIALVHEVCVFFGYELQDIDTASLGRRVRVEADKIPRHLVTGARDAEKRAGKMLSDNGIKVDFSSPETVMIYLTEKKNYYGKLVLRIDRNKLKMRDPGKRPYNFSGTVNAVHSRAFVNLARVTEGEVCDPFSGSGAFLLEAGVMGLSVFGCDTSKKHFFGARRNLNHFGVKRYDLRLMDALTIKELNKKFDGIVTDLPWGINTGARYHDKKELYGKFMNEIVPSILKKGRYAVISCDMKRMHCPQELELVQKFALKVHENTTRIVRVFRKS